MRSTSALLGPPRKLPQKLPVRRRIEEQRNTWMVDLCRPFNSPAYQAKAPMNNSVQEPMAPLHADTLDADAAARMLWTHREGGQALQALPPALRPADRAAGHAPAINHQ